MGHMGSMLKRVFFCTKQTTLYCLLVNIDKYRRVIVLKGFQFFLDLKKILFI